MPTISEGYSAVIDVENGDSITLNSGKTDAARLTITTGSGAGNVVTASHSGRKTYGPFYEGTVTLEAVSGYCTYYLSSSGADDAQREVYFVKIAEADLSGLNSAGRPIPVGVQIADPTTGLVYGQSDGAGGYERITPYSVVESSINTAYASQFATVQQTLQVRSIPVSATGQAYLGPCAVLGIRAVTLGTGTMTIHDGTAASDATLLRMSRAHSAMVAGTYYPMVSSDASDRAALLCDTGVYFTVASGGEYWLDIVDGTAIPGTVGAGQLCVATRIAASGLALTGPATVVAIKVIAPGSSGNLDIRGGPVVGSPLLHPSTAFGSLAADQIIKLGVGGGGATVDGLYLTIPTGAIVLVFSLPR